MSALSSLQVPLHRLDSEAGDANGHPQITSGLEELITTLNPDSFHILFQMAEFPKLQQANILIMEGQTPRPTTLQESNIPLPSLHSLSYIDASHHPKCLRTIQAPLLSRLAYKINAPRLATIQEDPAPPPAWLPSPKTLELAIDGNISLFEQTMYLDLSETVSLHICTNGSTMAGARGTSPRLVVPKLQEIHVLCDEDFFSVLDWIELRLAGPPKFNLVINNHCVFKLIRNGSEGRAPDGSDHDGGLSYFVTSLELPADREYDQYATHFGCNHGVLPSIKLCEVLSANLHCYLSNLSTASAITRWKDLSHPMFSHESFSLKINAVRPVNWRQYFSVRGVGLAGGEQSTVAPRRLAVNRTGLVSAGDIDEMKENLRDLIAWRKEAGTPLEQVTLIYRSESDIAVELDMLNQ